MVNQGGPRVTTVLKLHMPSYQVVRPDRVTHSIASNHSRLFSTAAPFRVRELIREFDQSHRSVNTGAMLSRAHQTDARCVPAAPALKVTCASSSHVRAPEDLVGAFEPLPDAVLLAISSRLELSLVGMMLSACRALRQLLAADELWISGSLREGVDWVHASRSAGQLYVGVS